MHGFSLKGHVAIWIEVGVEMTAGLDSIVDLDAPDLDHPVAASRVETSRFRIEDNFPHA